MEMSQAFVWGENLQLISMLFSSVSPGFGELEYCNLKLCTPQSEPDPFWSEPTIYGDGSINLTEKNKMMKSRKITSISA